MQHLRSTWANLLDQQHREPAGLLGRIIAERMRHQHAPETAWAFALLQMQPQHTVLEIGFGAGHGIARALQQVPHGHVVGVNRSATLQTLGDLLVPGGCCVSVFATRRRLPSGHDEVWPLKTQAKSLVTRFAADPRSTLNLLDGPDSRQFNNVALILDRRPVRNDPPGGV